MVKIMVKNEKLMELLKVLECSCCDVTNYNKLYDALMQNIREDAAREGIGNKKQLTIIKSMLAAVKHNAAMQKVHPYGEQFAFIDGYRIFVTNNSYNYDVAADHEACKIDKMLVENKADMVPIKIDAESLALHIKTTNKRDKKPYIIRYNNKLIGLNPYYLRDALQFFNCDTLYINVANFGRFACYKSPVYFYGENGEMGILLPVNVGVNKAIDDVKTNQEITDAAEAAVKQTIADAEAKRAVELEAEAIENNNAIIAENKAEYMRIYEDIRAHAAVICENLKNEDASKRLRFAECLDCMASIYEDLEALQFSPEDMAHLDHVNYKLHNYSYDYIGDWSENEYKFEYRAYKVYNHLHRRITLKALQAIQQLQAELLDYMQEPAADDTQADAGTPEPVLSQVLTTCCNGPLFTIY